MLVVSSIFVSVLTGLEAAVGERVPDIARRAAADGIVVDHVALGVDAAHPSTGVDTLVDDTGQGGRAVAVEDTLWAAGGRSAKISRLTRANRSVLRDATFGVGPAGGRAAGVRFGSRVWDESSWN